MYTRSSASAEVTLGTGADESRNKMVDGVTRSPARLRSRVGKICYYERLEGNFLILCHASSTSAAVALGTGADESRNKMVDGVTRSPARLCSRVEKIGYYERLEYDLLLFCLASYISYFLLPDPGMFSLLRVPSSVQQQQSSATVLSARI